MTAAGRKRTLPIWSLAVILAILLAGYLIYVTLHQRRNLQELCAEALPQNQRVGIKLKASKNREIEIDLSGQRGTQTGATPAQIEAFVNCLSAMGFKVGIENGVRIALEPVGQVANRWRRETGLKLRLMPGVNDEALNNLRIGPATGRKEDVVRDWCSQKQAGACVTCEPEQPTADTTEVVVRLRSNAPVERHRLDGVWPAPPPGDKPEPWQIVNADGERFYYECKRPP